MTTTTAEPTVNPTFDVKLSATLDAWLDSLPRSLRTLTASEKQEARFILVGLTCAQAATLRSVSGETVRATRKRIYRKLDLDSASALAAAVLRFTLSR